jgi:hypothetical protein
MARLFCHFSIKIDKGKKGKGKKIKFFSDYAIRMEK